MIVTTIKGFTNVLGEPKDWDRQANGEVFGLPVRIEPQGDTISVTSAWKPTAEEMAALLKGAPIHLRVVGGQPPVSVYVEGMPESLDPDFSEADARRVLLLSKALRLCQSQFEAYASLHAAKHTPDGDEKAATNRQIASLCADALEGAGSSDAGYVDAFYDLAQLLGIGARAKSPAEVWQTEMRPKVAALIDGDGAAIWRDIDRDAIITAVTGVKQAFSEDALTYKLDRREIDDLVDAIVSARAQQRRAASDQHPAPWSIPDTLRWLADQPGRPARIPAGDLTGKFLIETAARFEALASNHRGQQA